MITCPAISDCEGDYIRKEFIQSPAQEPLLSSSPTSTLSQIATFVLDSLSVSCSGVNLSSSHHGKSGGHDMPSRS